VQRFAIDDSYCGAHDMNHPIQGNEAITREAALTWTGPRVTAIAVTTTGQHTVAFVGTQNGLIYKV
jgi:Sema domain